LAFSAEDVGVEHGGPDAPLARQAVLGKSWRGIGQGPRDGIGIGFGAPLPPGQTGPGGRESVKAP